MEALKLTVEANLISVALKVLELETSTIQKQVFTIRVTLEIDLEHYMKSGLEIICTRKNVCANTFCFRRKLEQVRISCSELKCIIKVMTLFLFMPFFLTIIGLVNPHTGMMHIVIAFSFIVTSKCFKIIK